MSRFWILPLAVIVLLGCKEEVTTKDEQFFVETEIPKLDLFAQISDSLEKYPDNIDLWIEKGKICKEKSDFGCALDAGAKAFMLDSTNLEARKLYAWTLINKPNTPVSDIESSQRHFQYVLSIQPRDPESLVNLANTFSLTGDFSTALKYINEALKIDEFYRDGYVLKGSIYKTIGNSDLALSSYQTAVQIDPQFFMGHLQLGWLLTSMENHQLALEYYRNAAELDSENISALYGIAKSLQDLGKYDEALYEYRQLSIIESSFYYAYYNQAFIKQYHQNELDSAAYYYNKVLFYNDNYVQAWYQLGNVFYDQKNYARSLEAYGKALDIDPEYTAAIEAAERLRNIKID